MGSSIKQPSPGTVIATIALFVALGGTAAALKGTNTIGNGDVKDLKFTNLNLKNGWEDSHEDTGKAGAAIDAQGVVRFRGAIERTTGTNTNAFRLPRPYRPNRDIWLPVYALGAADGYLFIDQDPAGQSGVGGEARHVSLEGLTFSKR